MMRIKTQLRGALFQASAVTGIELIKQKDRQTCLANRAGQPVQWRWRELNPRPKDSTLETLRA